MVNSALESETNVCFQPRLSNDLTSSKSLRRTVDDQVFNDVDLHSHSLKNITPNSHELKLNIKRVDENHYVSMISPHLIKIKEKSQACTSSMTSCDSTTQKKNSRKSLRWSERNENNVMNLVEELMNDCEGEDEILYTPKKTSVPSFSKSNSIVDELESVTPKRTRKPVKRFGESVDLNDILNTPTKINRTQKTSILASSPGKSNITNELESVTPKRIRKPVNRYGESLDSNEVEILNTTTKNKRTHNTSVSELTPRKSNYISNAIESVTTPKRTRKSINRFVELNLDEIEIVNTPKSNKKRRKLSMEVIDKHQDVGFELDTWTTPISKNLRQLMTPTTPGLKVRRSILQEIPENKAVEIVSTPKTPVKTPKVHVKNLKASAGKRLDSGAKVPCSPLEKARASLHLHAAPKHLPCREVEFKNIHSFLARKINDELTGSMYISGVPGTGKTATVKRVIDFLNADLIMKHSFKFIEINGLRLANPHQAFSLIWKELTAQMVSSSRAQALLNDYFSGEEIRELSTILLIDEIDHICNRKQDVVYNILDWPSRIGSKVVIITIANTMDLPERVLRGCVTSRMGLTRLVFKPYTFQQLQEIIMNRLIGNSLFDPDAVQLVARKVAAISGDARRALDICRRALDLIKSEDSQLITINHVNQVLNSILSGVRVTAIRCCSLLEQFFLRALRDETNRTGFDHSTIDSVYNQMKNICLLEGEDFPNDQLVIMMAYRLRDSGLIFLEKKRCDIFRKVSLNVSPEDISYALDKYNN